MKPSSPSRFRAPSRYARSASASAGGSSIPSTRPRWNVLARARPRALTSSASRLRSSPPMPALKAVSSCSMPRRCPAILTMAIRLAPFSMRPKPSRGVRSSAPSSIKDTAATTPKIRAASSSPDRSAASSPPSSDSSNDDPPSSRLSAT